jgi:peptide/nickel transport system ATP-binding protein
MSEPAASLGPTAAPPREAEPLVRCENLTVRFVGREGTIHAVNGVNFTLDAGEVLCILGESGSGKTVTLRAMMRLLPAHTTSISGEVIVAGRNVTGLDRRALEDMRGAQVAMIFQEPLTSFDPIFTIGTQIIETLKRHDGLSERRARQRALDLLEMVQIPSPARRLGNYPHEMSGGMRQRAMIALALACKPQLLLADEPTTALDATVQIQILQLLRRLQRELGMAVLFVTHDVGVAVEISDRIAVMYAGRFVETGPVRAIIREPQHPYTRGLLASTVHGAMRGRRLQAIPGSPANLAALPPGCAFAPRCRYVEPACTRAVPSEIWRDETHMVRCIGRLTDHVDVEHAEPLANRQPPGPAIAGKEGAF